MFPLHKTTSIAVFYKPLALQVERLQNLTIYFILEPMALPHRGLRPNQSSNSVNTLSISGSTNPTDNSSSNSFDNSSSNSSSNPIDVDVANLSDRPRNWIPDVESNLKPSKGHIFLSLTQAYNFYRHYGKLRRGGKKRDSKYDNHKYDTSVANRDKGKGKAVDDGSNGKGKKIDVSKVSESAVNNSFRKNTSRKTGRVRKIDGIMFEVYVFVEEHNHPLVSLEDIQFLMSSRDLGSSKHQFLFQVLNSNVGPVRVFKLMKEMYEGFENIGATAVDCKFFTRDLNMCIGDRDAQMAMEKLENLEKHLVVTDQDASMKQAVESEFPNARHWLCMWHIMQKLVSKWASVMDEFKLGSHKWLSDIYDMRVHCIPAFLRDEDMSGLIRTTLRSESENRYFNRWTNLDLTLVEFLSHFDSTMDSQRYVQRKNDHESCYNRLEFRTEVQLEKDVADLYTLGIFYDVQDEIYALITHCLSVNVEHIGLNEKYFIRNTEVKKWKDNTAFEVYKRMNNVDQFPREYVLDRWSKSVDNVWVDAYADVCESSSHAIVRAIRQIVEDTVDNMVPFKD
ncbi:FAR1 DNA binding domain, zinc finger, SWIM-type, MULE transposase domain containing protein [Tanacetum coccineum]|uniref:FAR1 DNA binding domain, zinc finger, SWIM-type, MULE transposase domain containing protein n=1 Tax=Tanacetum coccineum TaxID=301880 RepID=A0ABQ5AH24_9ASTR